MNKIDRREFLTGLGATIGVAVVGRKVNEPKANEDTAGTAPPSFIGHWVMKEKKIHGRMYGSPFVLEPGVIWAQNAKLTIPDGTVYCTTDGGETWQLG